MLVDFENLLDCLPMKILIEDADKLEYLTTEGGWTKDATAGRSFAASEAAFAVAKQESVGRFNIVRYFKQTRQIVNLNHGKGKGAAEAVAV